MSATDVLQIIATSLTVILAVVGASVGLIARGRADEMERLLNVIKKDRDECKQITAALQERIRFLEEGIVEKVAVSVGDRIVERIGYALEQFAETMTGACADKADNSKKPVSKQPARQQAKKHS